MKKLKICFNIDNITGLKDPMYPTYFIFLEHDYYQEKEYDKLQFIEGISYNICETYLIGGTCNYLTVGNNGKTTRIVKNIDRKEEKELLFKVIDENPGILRNLDKNNLDIIIDQITMDT